MRFKRQILSCLILLYGLFTNSLSGQTKAIANGNKEIFIKSPFEKLQGSWVSYSKESTFAAYTTITMVSKGAGYQEFFESKNGEIGIGLFFYDSPTSTWGYTLVDQASKMKSPVGVKWLMTDEQNRFIFEGTCMNNGIPSKDRMTFEFINQATMWKTYEISTDLGQTWDIEYKLTFKKLE